MLKSSRSSLNCNQLFKPTFDILDFWTLELLLPKILKIQKPKTIFVILDISKFEFLVKNPKF